MKYTLAMILCFVFVSLAAGQGGYGRVRKPKKPVVHPKPLMKQPKPFVNPKPIMQKPVVADPWTMRSPIGSLSGGGFGQMPPEIARIIGRTVSGMPMQGGRNGLPIHGGSGTEATGLRNGWGADPNAPLIAAVSNWESPMNGAAYPVDFAGEELIFDAPNNRYIRKHQQAKDTQYINAQEGFIMPGGGPFDQTPFQAEHNIVKEATHVARKTIGGISPVMGGGPMGNPMGHQVEKQIIGQQMHNTGKMGMQNHNIVKSSGIISAGKPSYIGKGPIKAGMMGQTNPVVMSHNIGKATHGTASMVGHNIAKSSGPATGIGFINPAGHVAQEVMHNNIKSVGGGMISAGKPSYLGKGPMNPGIMGPVNPGVVSHNIGKATHGVDSMVGHNIAKSSGPVSGVGFINPAGHVAQEVMHNNVKSVGGGMISAGKPSYLGRGPMNPGIMGSAIGHNIAKSSGPVSGVGFINPNGHVAQKVSHNIAKSTGGAMIGGPMGGGLLGPGGFPGQNIGLIGGPKNGQFGGIKTNPVHKVGKVINSGMLEGTHDSLALAIGGAMAENIMVNAADAVDMGSNGGVMNGDPRAIAASQELARESIHVAKKTLGIASQSNPISKNGPIGVGNNIFGGGLHKQPVYPDPVFTQPIKPKPVFIQPVPPKPVFNQHIQHKPVFKQQVLPKPVVKKPKPQFTGGYGRRRV